MARRFVPTSLQFFKRLRWIDGTPLSAVIEPYRRAIFQQALDARDARGHPRYNLVLTGRGKKNWKSADLVLAALYRLLAWQSPQGNQCFLLANDLDQASDDLELATKLVKANPPLAAAVTCGANEITRKDGRGYLLVLPAKDIAGSHGGTYLFMAYDEIHAYADWALLEATQPDPFRPDALQWFGTYNTLTFRPGVPLYDLLAKGKAGTDPKMFFSWYAADYTTDPDFADASPEDRANPSRGSWEDPHYLDQQRRRLPTVRFRRLHLNLPGYPDGGAYDAVKLDAAVERGVRVRPPQPGVQYAAFVDMSGGSSDSCALAVGHVEQGRRVVDGVWDQGQRPPFNPKDAIGRFVGVLQAYRVARVMADTYGTKAPTLDFRREFEARGVAYVPSPLTKPELYEHLEIPLNSGEAVLPDDPETLEQLAGLQRRGLKIDHRAGEHDDRANALAGVTWLLREGMQTPRPELLWAGGDRRSAIPSPAEGSLIWSSTSMPRPWHTPWQSDSPFDRYDRGELTGQHLFASRTLPEHNGGTSMPPPDTILDDAGRPVTAAWLRERLATLPDFGSWSELVNALGIRNGGALLAKGFPWPIEKAAVGPWFQTHGFLD